MGGLNLDEIVLDHTEQSIKIGDGTANFLSILEEDAASTGGEFGIMSLGIRMDGSGSPISADGDYHPLVFNAVGELKTTASLNNTSNTGLTVTQTTVTNVTALLVGSAVSARKEITIQNLGPQDFFINEDTATTSDLKIPKRSSATYCWGDTIDVAAITVSATADARILESA